MSDEDKVGRWSIGDLARDENGDFLEVIGIVRSPMVAFRKVGSQDRRDTRYEVAGCQNELKGLQRFERKERGK